MKKPLLAETPMGTLEEVRNWHQEQVERHKRLAETRNLSSGYRFEKTLHLADLRRADFHQRAVKALNAVVETLDAADGNSRAQAALNEMSNT
jgi:hypothetical protein